ncbi:MAG: flagellar protein FlbT [Geobacter sp.]|nr:flagellar protein FlbT [Geobacter sp.]
MSLKLKLKPDEKLVIGRAVIRNGSKPAELLIENDIPILREKDILSEKDANSPARRVYFTIQLMYIDPENLVSYHNRYWELVRDIIYAAPSTKEHLEQISEQILNAHYYQALRLAKKLIDYEEELLAHVTKSL